MLLKFKPGTVDKIYHQYIRPKSYLNLSMVCNCITIKSTKSG